MNIRDKADVATMAAQGWTHVAVASYATDAVESERGDILSRHKSGAAARKAARRRAANDRGAVVIDMREAVKPAFCW